MSDKPVQIGDTVKATGNHCYKGREGVVIKVEDVDGTPYIHISLNGDGTKIIMRPGQYEVTKRGKGNGNHVTLSEQVVNVIDSIANNGRYGLTTRIDTLEIVREHLDEVMKELEAQRDAKEWSDDIGSVT